jgi:pyruvate dehydrogenase E2 component (dihydrolipoamide acetyltransferase)
MDEGTIARWRIENGQKVTKGDVIAEVESNKAVFELEATASGVMHIVTPAGQTVPVLALIGHILAPGEAAPGAAAATPAPVAATAAPAAAEAVSAAPAAPVAAAPGRQFVSPRARRTAGEKGVDVALVTGSGPNGRVEERDVLAFLASQPRLTPLARKAAAEAGVAVSAEPHARVTRADVEAMAAQKAAPAVAAAPVAPAAPAAAPTVAPLGVIRRVIAQKMAESAHTAAAVTLTTEVDATELVHLREQIKEFVQKATGQNPSYNVLLAKISAIALREFPYMNNRIVGNEMHTLTTTNVGIAVDTERGLLVPVLRDVASKGILALTVEGAALFAKATSGAISADEMAGGNFTITNLGSAGVDAFTPIINMPESAILGVGRIAPRPAVYQGQIAIRQMVVLSLTFDHRVVDGAPAARFLQRIAQLVENPYALLLV